MRRSPQQGTGKLLTLGVALLLVVTLGASVVDKPLSRILNLLAASISSFTGTTTTVFFTLGSDKLFIGGTTSVDVNINTQVAINAMGATISFPRDTLEIISISKEKSFFDLWTEDTIIAEEAGEIRFSGGTLRQGGLVGTGTVLTLQVRAKNAGAGQLQFKNVLVYPSNDTGKALDTEIEPVTLTIVPQPALSVGSGASTPTRPSLPNPDLNGDGRINLIDLSILTFKMAGPYNARYDLNSNGSVGLDDLSILFSKM